MDWNLQADLALRLLGAAVLGAAIGAEREFHDHPAGMRTHLLLSVGCAMFTVLSIYGFETSTAGTAPVDPSRVAAQIVTGMGFLGAGAILKYGTSIRGLTTAASIWATSAIGVAVGTGQWVLGVVGTTIVLVSLSPLNRLSQALRGRKGRTVRARLLVSRLETLADISAALSVLGVRLEGLQTIRKDDRFELELSLHLPDHVRQDSVLAAVGAVPGVDLLQADHTVE